LGSKEVMAHMFELQKKNRFFATAYSRRDLGDQLAQDPYYGAVISQAKNDAYISLPLISRTYDQGLNDEIVSYLEQAITQSVNGVDYARAMKTAQSGVSQVLKKYNISE
jgi:multiple sugar transport system substrate-binding protein